MRLAKYLAAAGIASRRAAEELVRAGRVTVGGEPVLDLARNVDAADAVAVDGEPVRIDSERVVYAVNKPPGVVSTARDPQRRPTIVSLVAVPQRLYPVGRLDIDSTGLILLTNDGELAYRLTHPKFEVEKAYRAVLARPPVRDKALRSLRTGVALEDGLTAPARVRRLAPDTIEITIHEGRNRQVKRMCEHVGHRVKQLERVSFGPLALGDLKPGAYRRLNETELRALASATNRGTSAGSAARPGAGSSSSGRPRRAPG